MPAILAERLTTGFRGTRPPASGDAVRSMRARIGLPVRPLAETIAR